MIMRFPLFSFLIILFVSACTPAPQPFRHDRTGFDPTTLRLRDAGTVMIEPLDGAQTAMGEIITSTLVEGLAARNIAATNKQIRNPAYVIRGQFVANRDQTTTERGSIFWTFKDRSGRVLEETLQPVRADYRQWNFGDQASVDLLVEQAANTFASYLQDKTEIEAAQNPGEAGIRFLVNGVNGAPGDGSQALEKAMRLTLGQFGAQVVNQLGNGIYQLNGQVDVLDPFEGQQRVIIDWIVLDDEGFELGRANQNNRVPQGSLDGKWGRLAYAISQGAMSGIGEIVEKHELEKRWDRSRGTPDSTAAPGRRSGGLAVPF